MYNIYIAITTLKIHTIIYIVYIFTNKMYKVYKQQNSSAGVMS